MLLFALELMLLATAAARIPVKEGVKESPKGTCYMYARNAILSVKRLKFISSIEMFI